MSREEGTEWVSCDASKVDFREGRARHHRCEVLQELFDLLCALDVVEEQRFVTLLPLVVSGAEEGEVDIALESRSSECLDEIHEADQVVEGFISLVLELVHLQSLHVRKLTQSARGWRIGSHVPSRYHQRIVIHVPGSLETHLQVESNRDRPLPLRARDVGSEEVTAATPLFAEVAFEEAAGEELRSGTAVSALNKPVVAKRGSRLQS